MWENRDKSLSDLDVDLAISQVLKLRNPNAIRVYRNAQGWVRKKEVKQKEVKLVIPTTSPVIAPTNTKRGDNLPDIGEQVAKLIEKQTMIEQTVWAINVKVAESNEHAKLITSLMKETLDLWRSIDARGKAPKQP
jgi:hypothetical protein